MWSDCSVIDGVWKQMHRDRRDRKKSLAVAINISGSKSHQHQGPFSLCQRSKTDQMSSYAVDSALGIFGRPIKFPYA